MIFGLHHSFELQACIAEVDEQANIKPIRFKVIDGLREVYIFQLHDSFEFYHNQFFHKKINPAGSYIFALEKFQHLLDLSQNLLGQHAGKAGQNAQESTHGNRIVLGETNYLVSLLIFSNIVEGGQKKIKEGLCIIHRIA